MLGKGRFFFNAKELVDILLSASFSFSSLYPFLLLVFLFFSHPPLFWFVLSPWHGNSATNHHPSDSA